MWIETIVSRVTHRAGAFHPLGWRVWIETHRGVIKNAVSRDFTRWDGGCGLKRVVAMCLWPRIAVFHPLGWRVWIETRAWHLRTVAAQPVISPAGMAGVD